jgi:hypothetical protein
MPFAPWQRWFTRRSRRCLSQPLGVEQLGGACPSAATGRRTPLLSHPELEPLEQRLVLSWTRPAAITYNGVLHVFTTGFDGHVYDRYSSDNVNWTWIDRGCAGGVEFLGSPAVTTYAANLLVYLTGKDGHLYVLWWDGSSSWHWYDHGNSGSPLVGDPGVTTYLVGTVQWMHVFVVGQSGDLYDKWWNGNSWTWDDRGTAGRSLALGHWPDTNAPAVTTYALNGVNGVHAWVTDTGGHLDDLYTYDNGAHWHFDDHGNPGASVLSSPGVATYRVYGYNQMHVFVATDTTPGSGDIGELWDHWWDGSWHWSLRGVNGEGIPAVTTYWNPTTWEVELLAFVTSAGRSRLDVAYTYDGVHWYFDNRGNGGSLVFNDPVVVVDAANRLHVFMHGDDGQPSDGEGALYDLWSDGATWYWKDWGTPHSGY